MRRLTAILAGTGLVLGVVACVGTIGDGSSGGGRASADPAAAVTDQWAAHGGDHSEQRHSPLTQINDSNVKELGLAWHADVPERGGYQTTPVVVDGTLI